MLWVDKSFSSFFSFLNSKWESKKVEYPLNRKNGTYIVYAKNKKNVIFAKLFFYFLWVFINLKIRISGKYPEGNWEIQFLNKIGKFKFLLILGGWVTHLPHRFLSNPIPKRSIDFMRLLLSSILKRRSPSILLPLFWSCVAPLSSSNDRVRSHWENLWAWR